MPAKKKPPVRSQYFNAIKEQKLDTLRWCLRHGGVNIKAEDDNGHTAVQIAAAGGLDQALGVLIEHVRKFGLPEDIEEPDEDGRTPLMMAAYNGKLACVQLLVLEGKAKLDAESDEGKTARAYAKGRHNDKVVGFLDNPSTPVESEKDAEETAEEIERKRVFKASQKLGLQANKQEEVHRAKMEAAEALQKALEAAPKPVWPEVVAVLRETRRELSLKGKQPLDAPTGVLDPTIFNCVCLFDLRLEIANGALTSLPRQLSNLTELTTLIVSNNALEELPECLGALPKLRVLEVANNRIRELPAPLAQLKQLQVVDVTDNEICSIDPLVEMTELVTLKVGKNKITAIDLAYESLEHLGTLAAPNNKITRLPRQVGCLPMLVSLDMSHNKIQQIPVELGNLTVKKLQTARFAGNPLADPRIRRFVDEDSPSMVKDLLNHVRKNGWKEEQGKGRGKGKKGKGGGGRAVEEEPESDDNADIAALLAQMGGGSDSDG